MNKFKPGEIVRRAEPEKYSEKIYIIKEIKKIKKGRTSIFVKTLRWRYDSPPLTITIPC